MKRHRPFASICLSILVVPLFALTVELIDNYVPSPGATLAVASGTVPANSPLTPPANLPRANPQIVPATFTVPQPSSEQAPHAQPSVDFNYRYTPGS